MTSACSKKEDLSTYTTSPIFNQAANAQQANETSNSKTTTGKMLSLDITNVGRSDPFMPYSEYKAFEDAKARAIKEATEHNAEIAKLERLKDVRIREQDDISPYSFNLPVPPTSLASEDAAASKITKTKVVGIMYNDKNPSAIINIDDKDYLVRQGDKIIGETFTVQKINQSWVTVNLGSNVYSAAIGEEFSKDEVYKYQNDIYDLKHRFGGRKG